MVRRIILMLMLSALFAGEAAAQWHIKEATVRFKLSPGTNPTHESCGYFTVLPDGGIMPGPAPVAVAVDSSGSPLKCAIMGWNRNTGLAVVFKGASDGDDVYIYIKGGESMNSWSPATGLTPSAIVCQSSGQSSPEAARALTQFGAVSPNEHFHNRAGGSGATVAIGGDLSGRRGALATYMLLYLNVTDPGNIWVAPMTWNGKTTMYIDGQQITPAKKNTKSGGTGQDIQLSGGLHKCDIFHSTGNSGSGAGSKTGLMALLWRTPKTEIKQLGGKRPADLKYPGTPMWEARHLTGAEVAKSGSCSIVEVKSRDGGPVAYPIFSATQNYWFGRETPVFLYKLKAFTSGNPESTRYVWTFGDQARIISKNGQWFFKGHQNQQLKLTAIANGKTSSSTMIFYPFSTVRTSMNDWGDREAFRDAAYEVFTSYPEGVDPTASWDESIWNNFFRCMELGHGGKLLVHIFTKRWDHIKNNISLERRYLLEDQFIYFLGKRDAAKAAYWITGQIKDKETDEYRKKEFTVKLAELYMYYLDDLDKAREILTPLTEDSEPVNELAKIRYGDIEFLAGDINKASAMYGNVQDRVNLHKRKERLKRPPPTAKDDSRKPHQFKEVESKFGSGSGSMKKKKKAVKNHNPAKTLIDNGDVAKWKLTAILETSTSETVKTYMDQKFYQEAKNAMDAWEMNFPLSKIQSDFIIQEAELLLVFKDYRRARKMLEAYCSQVDASNYIFPALEMLLDCMLNLKEPQSKLLETCEKMKERLEFHPSAEKLDDIIKVMKGSKGTREATSDMLEDIR